jgi:hypothetical protein
MTDGACSREGITSCQSKSEAKTDGEGIQHPNMSIHYLMHDFTDAINFECLVQSKQTADVANGDKEVEHCSES